MRRDMDLVRAILMAVEAKATPEGVWMSEIDVPDWPDDSIRRKHFVMMAEAGFFECEPTRSTTNPSRFIMVLVFDLSWKGHEYLDTIRDPKVWKNAKAGVRKIGGSSFDFVIEVAKAMGRGALRDAGIPGM